MAYHLLNQAALHVKAIFFRNTQNLTSEKIAFCDNVQSDKKCDLLVQCDIKMVQYDKIVVNNVS